MPLTESTPCEPCEIDGDESVVATFRYHLSTCKASILACEKHRALFGEFAGRIEDLPVADEQA